MLQLNTFLMKYRALIVDVDGTLIENRRDAMPSNKVKEAIAKASKYLHVGIATSRPIGELHQIVDDLALSGPSIIDAGAQIIDFPTRKILIQKPLLLEDYVKICAILKGYTKNMLVNDNGVDTVFFKSLIPKNPLNIFVLVPIDKAESIMNKLSQISTIAMHEIVLWKEKHHEGKIGIEITHASTSKQNAIFEVAKLLGITTHEIIGVGDGYTDFPLLMACGLKVAMGNAVDEIKAIADYVAPSVDEDGVADVINKFVLN